MSNARVSNARVSNARVSNARVSNAREQPRTSAPAARTGASIILGGRGMGRRDARTHDGHARHRRRRKAPAYELAGCARVCLMPRMHLSDLLYASALAREACARGAEVLLVVCRRHAGHVRALFADVAGLRFEFADDWRVLGDGKKGDGAPQRDGTKGAEGEGEDGGLLARLEAGGYRPVPLPSMRRTCPYALLGLGRGLARSGFRLQRRPDVEERLLARVREAVGNTYVIVHDDERRRIKPRLLPPGVPVVSVRDPRWRTACLFDWIRVIDCAAQLHAIDSCVLLLADLLDLSPRKFCHAYLDAEPSARTHSRDVVCIWA